MYHLQPKPQHASVTAVCRPAKDDSFVWFAWNQEAHKNTWSSPQFVVCSCKFVIIPLVLSANALNSSI